MSPLSFLIMGLAAFATIVLGIESGGKRDDIICGNYPMADKGNVMEIEWDLRTRETDEFTIKGKGCKRLICWNTSAIYVCSNRDENETRTMKNRDVIDQVVHDILPYCCRNSQVMATHYAVSGEMIRKEQQYSIIVAYANCNKGDDFRPDEYPAGPGPNGWCT